MNKILFIASIPAENLADPQFLAAHKKIFQIMETAHDLGFDVLLLNSTPKMNVSRCPEFSYFETGRGCRIQYLNPRRYIFNRLGRVLNLLQVEPLLDIIKYAWGIPEVIWCYNGYAFEMRVARLAKKMFKPKVILEFEDWHFARAKIYNIKAILDWYFWRRSIGSIDIATAVNDRLLWEMSKFDVDSVLLPGLLAPEGANLLLGHRPFPQKDRRSTVRCGYFGGLTIEKGGLLLLTLIEQSLESELAIHWTITGLGDLEERFASLSSRSPDQVSFHGKVSDGRLYQLMGNVDVIVNPHIPGDGFFPFKVVEAVGSGRLVVSSRLSLSITSAPWLAVVVQLPDESSPLDWLNAISNAEKKYFDNEALILEAAQQVAIKYGKEGFAKTLRELLGAPHFGDTLIDRSVS